MIKLIQIVCLVKMQAYSLFAYPGLNCAEAVNFAPADWIPHGGFCAELYQLYRKPAILSHEELLYVVGKVIGILYQMILISMVLIQKILRGH